MCIDPITLLMISTAVSTVGSIVQGNQQADMMDYQRRQAEADAQASAEQGQVQADKIRKAGRLQQSEAKAALAASGVETGAGTPVKIVSEIWKNTEQDAQQAIIGGNRQAANLQSEASASAIAGRNARTAGYLRAGGSLLQGGYGIAQGWRTAPAATSSASLPGSAATSIGG